MAKLIATEFVSGRYGNLVFTTWRDMAIVRTMPKKSNKPATSAQLWQRYKMQTVTKFLSPLAPLITAYFGERGGLSRRSKAISYHMINALHAIYPELSIDYARVVISKGELAEPRNVLAAMTAGGLQLSWNNPPQALSNDTDTLLVVIYNANRKAFEYQKCVMRSALHYSIALPEIWLGDMVHCWLSFVDDDLHQQSNTYYAGSYLVA